MYDDVLTVSLSELLVEYKAYVILFRHGGKIGMKCGDDEDNVIELLDMDSDEV